MQFAWLLSWHIQDRPGSSANETHANQLVQLGFSLGRGVNRTGPHGRGWEFTWEETRKRSWSNYGGVDALVL